MKQENLIAYAMNFASFLLEEKIAKNIDQIILFGSVARDDFDEKSDIDLFIESKKDIEKEVAKILSLFRQSETQRKWQLKGLKNELSVKVGDLNIWKLKRSIISDGIVLYGKFKEMPEEVEYYSLFELSFKKFKKSHKIGLWRKLYGYKQKVGKKVYATEGIVDKLSGKRMESGVIIPMKNLAEIISFLNKEKISYTTREIWSDKL